MARALVELRAPALRPSRLARLPAAPVAAPQGRKELWELLNRCRLQRDVEEAMFGAKDLSSDGSRLENRVRTYGFDTGFDIFRWVSSKF